MILQQVLDGIQVGCAWWGMGVGWGVMICVEHYNGQDTCLGTL